MAMSADIDWNSMTVIAGILGSFFIAVGVFKGLNKRGRGPGADPSSKSQDNDNNVKLFDPFAKPDDGLAPGALREVQPHERAHAGGFRHKGGKKKDKAQPFRMYSGCDAFVEIEEDPSNDSDYKWE